MHERDCVRTIRTTLDQEMNVIGHEAVRNHGHVEEPGGLQNLLQDELDDVSMNEPWMTPSGAKC
jgi:hypothetical protein